jgi:hypothetical protein
LSWVREERGLLLGLLLLRDVEHHALDQGRPSLGVAEHHRAVAEPHGVAVPGDEAVLGRERLARSPACLVGRQGLLAIVGMQVPGPELGVDYVLLRVTPSRASIWGLT